MRDVPVSGGPLAAALICLALAGCFYSEQPKFPLTSAVAIVGDGGRFAYYERDAKGAFQQHAIYDIRHRNDGAYDVVNDSGGVTLASVHPIANGMLVMQATPQDNKLSTAYFVVQAAGEEVLIYVPDCNKQDKGKLPGFGVVIGLPDKCLIDRVADPAALFATLKLGDPTGKIVRVAPGTPPTP